MCGFIGGLFSKKLAENIKPKISSVLKSFSYRGPDSEKIYLCPESKFILGFNRLSIIDLSNNGDQPFFFKDLVMSANCEIYNYIEIQQKLKNNVFKSKSDAETIVNGYFEKNTKIFDELQGMFAINIFDKKKNELIIARDRFGIKPIYYYKDHDSFVFSSEFFPLVRFLKKLNKIIEYNYDNFETFLFGPYNFTENTLIKNIKKLKPGTFLKVDKHNTIVEQSYFEIKKKNLINFTDFDNKTMIKTLEILLEKSVEKHLISDVPVGLLYSGGLDSSIIAHLASKKKENISCFTINFNNQFDNLQINQIKNFCKVRSMQSNIINATTLNVLDNFEKKIFMYDDLSSADPGFLTNEIISKKISENGYKVVLVGDGADEMFGGYSWFGLSKYPFKVLPKLIRDIFYFYSTSRTFNFNYFWKTFKKFRETLPKNEIDYFNTIEKNEIVNQLPNHYLQKVDRSTMVNSIEARVPYLDNDLYNFSSQLNQNLKLKGKFYTIKNFNLPYEKFILRELANSYFDKSISQKKKYGFSLSLYDLINHNKSYFKETLNTKNSFTSNFFGKDFFENSINKIKEAKYSPIELFRHNILWKFFLLHKWFKAIEEI
jgi:asparagine synthase (glutamine-hydrolysing)